MQTFDDPLPLIQKFLLYMHIQEEFLLAVCQGIGIWIWYWIHIILRQLTKYEYCIYSFISYKYQIYLLYQYNNIPISNIQTLIGILEYIHVTLCIGNGVGGGMLGLLWALGKVVWVVVRIRSVILIWRRSTLPLHSRSLLLGIFPHFSCFFSDASP